MSDDEYEEFAARPAGLPAKPGSLADATPTQPAPAVGKLAEMLQRDRQWESDRLGAEGAAPLTLTPEEVVAAVGPRPKQRRFGPLTIAISALSVILIAVLAFLLSARANAETPAEGAMRSFAEQKSLLTSANQSLVNNYNSYLDAHTDAVAMSAAAVQAISAVSGASDEAARVSVENARKEFEAALIQSQLPDPTKVPLSVPTVEDPTALSSVAAALNDIKSERDRIKGARHEVRSALSELQASRTEFANQVRAFGKTIPDTAAIINGQNPDAAQQWRDAVTAAAAAVAKDVSAGNLTATSSFQSYAATVVALRAENARVLAERAAAESEERDSSDSSGGNDSGNTGGGETVAPDPVAPVDPAPVDPQPPVDPPATTPPGDSSGGRPVA